MICSASRAIGFRRSKSRARWWSTRRCWRLRWFPTNRPMACKPPKAFVVAKPEIYADEALARELQDFLKNRLAPYKYPRFIEFVTELPKTAAGKVALRRELPPRTAWRDRLNALPCAGNKWMAVSTDKSLRIDCAPLRRMNPHLTRRTSCRRRLWRKGRRCLWRARWGL